MLSIDAAVFDVSGCTLVEDGEFLRRWIDADGVLQTLQLTAGEPPWTFDLADVNACITFFREQCAGDGGVMLSMDATVVGGCEALWGVFRYRSPKPYDCGRYFIAGLWIPFSDCWFQLNIELMEHGTTGVRESTITGLQLTQMGQWPGASDDERYDSLFPSHPLTHVRRRLHEATKTLAFSAEAGMLRPFRRAMAR